MQQRLCLAHALVHEPPVLLLDEPASGLDPRARVELRELLRELRSLGKTILISSHILPELEELCTAVAIVDRGRVLASGRVEDIHERFRRRRRVSRPRPRRRREAVAAPQGFFAGQPDVASRRALAGRRLELGAAAARTTPPPLLARAVRGRPSHRQLRARGERPRGAVPPDHRSRSPGPDRIAPRTRQEAAA